MRKGEAMNNMQSAAGTKSASMVRTRKMVMVGMLGAISTILMYFDFPVPLAPGFIKMDFSELPVIIGGFLLGPVSGAAVAFLKVLLRFILKGTDTMGVGEFSNLLGSLAYVLPAALFYKHLKTRRSAEYGLLAGTVTTSIVMVLANAAFVFPLYIKLFGMTADAIVKMGSAVNPLVNNMFTLMVFSILPFNLFKYGVISILTLLVYKKISRAYKSFK